MTAIKQQGVAETNKDRRRVLTQLFSLGAMLPFACSGDTLAALLAKPNGNNLEPLLKGVRYFGCAKREDNYYVLSFDEQFRQQFESPLVARGHGLAIAKMQRQLIVLDRRPGRSIHIFDALSGQKVQQIDLSPTLSLAGHAALHPDSQRLYVSAYENSSSEGLVQVYDWQEQHWELSETWPKLGTGPHELLAFEQGVVVAIGGIKTLARKTIELENIQAQLIFLNHQGKVLSRHQLDNADLSVRHLSGSWDKLVVACQAQLHPESVNSLVYLCEQQQSLKPLDHGAHYWPLFEGYIGSVEVYQDTIVASSPRAGLLGSWDATGQLKSLLNIEQVCGLTSVEGQLVVSTGTGDLGHQDQLQANDYHWDNHLLAASF
ncbi:DUF1513 domain-containing protein [Alginatibacterium sediminis]|uniref:DUF1513 domain-containing protein n=1 Tax=Alginatibacterium sediminis TaxID=2164068 RepID=A0A420E5R3_9ALTE|nr:DUF1513 domain-containing protein [Alginatibacterium sediminis]RKF12812.1 DUF1513 domain-containing protein [Alginatibacterium sediminis]